MSSHPKQIDDASFVLRYSKIIDRENWIRITMFHYELIRKTLPNGVDHWHERKIGTSRSVIVISFFYAVSFAVSFQVEENQRNTCLGFRSDVKDDLTFRRSIVIDIWWFCCEKSEEIEYDDGITHVWHMFWVEIVKLIFNFTFDHCFFLFRQSYWWFVSDVCEMYEDWQVWDIMKLIEMSEKSGDWFYFCKLIMFEKSNTYFIFSDELDVKRCSVKYPNTHQYFWMFVE